MLTLAARRKLSGFILIRRSGDHPEDSPPVPGQSIGPDSLLRGFRMWIVIGVAFWIAFAYAWLRP